MPRKTTTTPPRTPALPVLASQVHPLAMTTALDLAGGDVRRRQPVDARTVLVPNFPGQTFARRTGRRS
jgi:hypothetical protein